MSRAPVPTDLTSAYEVLRAQMTGEAARATPRGLTLLLQSGMPEWMRTCSAFAPRATATPPASTASAARCSTELVRLLTDMALARLERCPA